ncbi:MAG: hypothetical protein ACJ74C_00100 [Gaiellaceae bacterium]
MARRVVLFAVVALLFTPAVARANGDPASDYLLLRSIFLPFNAKVDKNATERLSRTIRAADKANFPIKVAVIGSRYDLGTAFSLYNKAQRYSEFLGLELSFQYRDRLLVVMPNGYGYSINGKPNPAGISVVGKLPPPGKDATKQVESATVAIRRLAVASGVVLPKDDGGGSETRDRLVIAAGAVALVALLAAIVLYRRDRARPPE